MTKCKILRLSLYTCTKSAHPSRRGKRNRGINPVEAGRGVCMLPANAKSTGNKSSPNLWNDTLEDRNPNKYTPLNVTHAASTTSSAGAAAACYQQANRLKRPTAPEIPRKPSASSANHKNSIRRENSRLRSLCGGHHACSTHPCSTPGPRINGHHARAPQGRSARGRARSSR